MLEKPLLGILLVGLWTALLPLHAQDAEPEKPAAPADVQLEDDPPEEPVEVNLGGGVRVKAGEEKVAVGHDITVEAGETARDVVVIYGTATIDGDVDGDVVVVAGKAKINGHVDGDVVLVLTPAELGDDAEIFGDTVVVGGPLNKAPGAQLHGELEEIAFKNFLPDMEWWKKNIMQGILLRPLPPRVGWVWVVAGVFFAMNLLIALLFTRPVNTCASTLEAKPVRSFLVGTLSFILLLPLMIILGWTVVAIPIMLCAFFVALLLGKVVVYRSAGGQIGKQFNVQALHAPVVAFCMGTILFYVIYMVPVLGWIVWVIATVVGVGAVVLTALSVFQTEGEKSKPTTPPPPTSFGPPVPSGAAPAVSSTKLELDPILPPPVIPPPSSIGGGAMAAAAPLGGFPPLLSERVPSQPSLSSAEMASMARAGFWPRLGASTLDIIILGLVTAATFQHPRFFIALMVAYHVAMWTWKGTTLGGVVLGLKCVRLDGQPLEWPVALVRSLASFLSFVPLGLGFLWASFTPERQSWHDIIAGTTIVKLPKPVSLI